MDGMTRADAAARVATALEPKPDLIVHGADLPATVAALRDVLATDTNLFDRGGVPVLLVRPADGGPPVARTLTYNNVIVQAHRHCRPICIDRGDNIKPVTLPAAVARMYLDLGEWRLPLLAGVSTAPLLTTEGAILSVSGYDPARGMWCEPAPDMILPPEPTQADAAAALLLLRTTFRTFPFKDAVTRMQDDGLALVDIDKPPGASESSFLAMLLTAACRPSLTLAPGALIVAPETTGAGSGKGLLVRAICAIAFGCQPAAFVGGHDRQELDKRLVAALIEAAPAVFLDNVNSTALRSNTLASVLTERPAHVRVMGESRMVPLNCSAFIAITGNGLTVSEDLARRFLIAELDAQCDDPEARPFAPGFLATVQALRDELLGACLTIWRWGRQNGTRLRRGLPLGSFETWAEWVRDPLLTLGCTDPVQRIRDAKANDPRRRFVAELFAAWWERHADRPIKAADLHETVQAMLNPQGRGRQYVAQRLLQMVGTRGGGFVLTHQPPAGGKTGGTYALKPTSSCSLGRPSSNSPSASRPQPAALGRYGSDELDASPPGLPTTVAAHNGVGGISWMPDAVTGAVAEAEGEI
jgi:hypothetical protein